MSKQTIKLLRGNNVTLLAACYERNETGEVVPMILDEFNIKVEVSQLLGEPKQLLYEVIDSNIISINCGVDSFDISGMYALEIVMNNSSGRNVRFAFKTAVYVVDYAEELGCDLEAGCNIVNLPPQVACNGRVVFSMYVVPGGIVVKSEVEALVAKFTEEYLKEFTETNYWFAPEPAIPTDLADTENDNSIVTTI